MSKPGFTLPPDEPESVDAFVRGASVRTARAAKPAVERRALDASTTIRMSRYEAGALKYLADHDQYERSQQKIARAIWQEAVVKAAEAAGYTGPDDKA